MPGRSEVSRFSWTLIDQGMVSVGSFFVNIALARMLQPREYGVFAVILATLLLLQIVNAAAVLYPATIRVASDDGGGRDRLIAATLLFVAVTTLVMSLLAAAGMSAFGRARLIPEVVGWFSAWQLQEALRRLLFAEFRYREAMVGDAISYLGQAIGVAALALSGSLTLPAVFIVLGATSLIGAAVQFVQVGVPFHAPRHIVALARDYWKLGSWSLAGSIAAALRFQGLFWLVGMTSGAADVAVLQAVLNVANVVNPVVTGICNLVPQTVSRALRGGLGAAWEAAKPYAIWGLAPTAGYAALAFVAPELLLRILYGASSPYAGEGLAVRIFAAVIVLNYAGEVAAAFLHGIGEPRLAWFMNSLGLAAVLCTFAALHPSLGWMAAVFAAAVGQIVRLLLFYPAVTRAASDREGLPWSPFRLPRPRA